MPSQTINVVHRTSVELRRDADGNLSVYVDEPEGVPLHEVVGVLELAKDGLLKQYP